HLSYSKYFNPQQISLTVWALAKSYDALDRRGDGNFRQYKRRLLDEALHGADYLVRVKAPAGSFLRSVGASGPEKKAEDRRIGREGTGFALKTNKNSSVMGETGVAAGKVYEVGYRAGGGVAIAALARAGTLP